MVASFNLRVKGLKRYGFRLHVSAPSDTTPDQRTGTTPPPYHIYDGRTQTIMDLQSDKKVTLTGEWTDENGNPTTAPADASVAYTVDNPGVILLTDNGDGSAVAAATGVLGTANVHADATGDGNTLSGDLQIIVVAGLAERFNIVAGEPEENTPDDGTGPE